jgi:hypothetical protein
VHRRGDSGFLEPTASIRIIVCVSSWKSHFNYTDELMMFLAAIVQH